MPMLLLVLLLFVFIFLFNTKAMNLFMEARFRHWIQNKKGYCDFLSHNSDFISENCDFIAISCLYLSRYTGIQERGDEDSDKRGI